MPADLEGLDALDHPRRRVDGDDARDRARGARPSRCASSSAPGTPVLGTCAGHDHARPRPSRGARHPRRAQRVRPPAALLRGRPRVRRARPAARSTPCSSARHGWPTRRRRRGARRASTAIRSRSGRATWWRSRFTPSCRARPGCTRCCWVLARSARPGSAGGLDAVRALVVAELALERGPVEPRDAVGLGRRPLVDRLVAAAAGPPDRVPRDSQAASAQTTIPAA